MKYQFPHIENISDIVPYVETNSTINRIERDWFTLFCYNVMSVFKGFDSPEHEAFLRECRGISFDVNTGKILARPPHKFHNVAETTETQPHMLSDDYELLEKLDGSMIFPIYNYEYDAFRLSTKRGITDTALSVECFVCRDLESKKYMTFFHAMWNQLYTPFFEYITPEEFHVVQYNKAHKLVLLGARHLHTGEYMSYDDLKLMAEDFDIDIVQRLDHITLKTLLSNVQNEVGNEGYVLNYRDGHKVKVKTDWYRNTFTLYNDMTMDYRLANLVIDGKADDYINSVETHAERIQNMQRFLNEHYTALLKSVGVKLADIEDQSAKNVSMNHAAKFTEIEITVVLAILKGKEPFPVYAKMMKIHKISSKSSFANFIKEAKSHYGIEYQKV